VFPCRQTDLFNAEAKQHLPGVRAQPVPAELRRPQVHELDERHRRRSQNHLDPEQRLHHRPSGCRRLQPVLQHLPGRAQPGERPAEARRQPDDANADRAVGQHAGLQPGQAGGPFHAAHRRCQLEPEVDPDVLQGRRRRQPGLGGRPPQRAHRRRRRFHAGRQHNGPPRDVPLRSLRPRRQRERPQPGERNVDEQFQRRLDPQLAATSPRLTPPPVPRRTGSLNSVFSI